MSNPEPTWSDVAPSARRRTCNKGRTSPPHPVHIEDVVALLDAIDEHRLPGPTANLSHRRLRALIVLPYRCGAGISEVLTLHNPQRPGLADPQRQGRQRRIVLMDEWGRHEL